MASLILPACQRHKNVINQKNRAVNIDFGTFEKELRQHGLTIREIQEVDQPYYPIPAKGIVVNNEQMIQVFKFKDTQEAEKARSKVLPDGRTIGTTKPFWAGSAHFFVKDTIVILYV
jgi:hypothetical protein